jgi:hypothetical protein
MFLQNTYFFFIMIIIIILNSLFLEPFFIFLLFLIYKHQEKVKKFYNDIYEIKDVNFISEKTFTFAAYHYSLIPYFTSINVFIIEAFSYYLDFKFTTDYQNEELRKIISDNYLNLILLLFFLFFSISSYLIFYFIVKNKVRKIIASSKQTLTIKSFVTDLKQKNLKEIEVPLSNKKFKKKFLKREHYLFVAYYMRRALIGLPNRNINRYRDQD